MADDATPSAGLSKSGYLTKQGHRVKNWKRRYFTVENGLLSYFESSNDTKHLGQINVANCSIEIAPEDRFKRANVFVITAGTGETLVLQCDGESELNAWIALLQKVAASCIYLAGPLFQLTGWRKKWRSRYFVLSGPRLAWYDSEANALAPGGASKPLGSIALLKTAEIEPVDGDKAAVILAHGKESASGSKTGGKGAGATKRSDDGDAGEAEAGDGEAGSGSSSGSSNQPTHVLLVTGAEGGKANGNLSLAVGNESDRDTWVTLLRCAADPERYPLPPRQPILVSRPQSQAPDAAGKAPLSRLSSTASLPSGGADEEQSAAAAAPASVSVAAADLLVTISESDSDEGPNTRTNARNPFAAPSAPEAASVLPAAVGTSSSNDQGLAANGPAVHAAAAAAPPAAASAPVVSLESASATVAAALAAIGGSTSTFNSSIDSGEPPAPVTPLQQTAGGGKSARPPRPVISAPAPSVASDGSQPGDDESPRAMRERIRREELERIRREEGDRIRREERSRIMRELGLSPGTDVAALARHAAPEEVVPAPALLQSDLLSPQSRALAERLAASEAELARERAQSALRVKQYEVATSRASERASRAERERDESRMRQRDSETELERQRLVARQAALELELERKRSKVNYTVNVVRTVEVPGPAAAAQVDVTAPAQEAAPQPQPQPLVDRRSRRGSLLGPASPVPPPAPLSSSSEASSESAEAPGGAHAASAPSASGSRGAESAAPEAPAQADAPAGAWSCEPSEGERGLMRRRVTDYLLRRTPSASSSPAQAAYLADVIVPSVEDALYRDAAGDLAAYVDPASLKARLRRVFAERAAAGSAPSPTATAPPAALAPATASEPAPAPALPEPAPAAPPSPPAAAPAVPEPAVAAPAGNPFSFSAPEPAAPVTDNASPPAGSDEGVREDGEGASASAALPVAPVEAAAPAAAAAPSSPEPAARRRPVPRQATPGAPSSASTPSKGGKPGATPASQQKARPASGLWGGKKRGSVDSDDDDDDEEEEEEDDDEDDDEDGSDAQGGNEGKRRVVRPDGTVIYVSRASRLPKRWGKRPHPYSLMTPPVPIRHFPAQLDGSVAINLVLEARPGEPPYLPDLNKWQHRQCAQCGRGQTTGMGFFTSDVKANFCWYTELLYCRDCMDPSPRVIPWRILHELDDKPRPVSKPAAAFIDPVLSAPIVNLPALAPATLADSKGLTQVLTFRRRLLETIATLGATAASLGGDEATVIADARRVAAVSLAKLGWLQDSPDLLPLSLVVDMHSDPTPAVKRLRMALAALQQFAEQRGLQSVAE